MKYQIHGIVADTDSRELIIDGEPVKLTKLEFQIFHLLAQSPGETISRRAIIDAVQGEDSPTGEQAMNVHVASLRKKLGNRRDLIETIRGVGFRMQAQ